MDKLVGDLPNNPTGAGAPDNGDEMGGFDRDGLARDPKRAWRLAEEARARGQWARAAKLVRIARAGVSRKAVAS